MKKRLFDYISLFETNLTAAEWMWRVLTFLVIAGGGTTTGLIARSSAYFRIFGSIVWIAVGLVSALIMSLIFYLIKLAGKETAVAEYTRAMAVQSTSVNPLLDSFTDSIIRLEDMRLPGMQLHKNKHFKRCKFVGPGAMAVLGGSYANSNFFETGPVIALPDGCVLTGIIVLQECIVEQCEFYKITIFTNKPIAEIMRKGGLPVVGI